MANILTREGPQTSGTYSPWTVIVRGRLLLVRGLIALWQEAVAIFEPALERVSAIYGRRVPTGGLCSLTSALTVVVLVPVERRERNVSLLNIEKIADNPGIRVRNLF